MFIISLLTVDGPRFWILTWNLITESVQYADDIKNKHAGEEEGLIIINKFLLRAAICQTNLLLTRDFVAIYAPSISMV